MTSTEPAIALENVGVHFDTQEVLRDLSFTIPTGQTAAIIGESGCGKTVLLKLLVGLLTPTAGRVLLNGQDVAKMTEAELTKKRLRVGLLFQQSALFDSLTVFDNVAFGLRAMKELSESEIAKRVRERLNEVGLPDGVEAKMPSELSGGMKKRVALARAQAQDPAAMLYDEPTTGLDPIMTDVINRLIIDLRKRRPITSVVVTHELRTVRDVTDRVIMLYPLRRLQPDEAQIIFDGTPAELENHPDPRVAKFVAGNSEAMVVEQVPRTGFTIGFRAMDLPRRRQQLGMFVIGGTALLTVLAVFFGGSPKLFHRRDHYTIIFEDAPGIGTGTPVRKSGVRIGEVESVELDDARGTVRVLIAVDPKFTIRDNEQPVISRDILSRDTAIDFMPIQEERNKPRPAAPPAGPSETKANNVPTKLVSQNPPVGPPAPPPTGKPISPGAEIHGVVPPDMRQMLRDASEMLPSAQMSLNQIRKSVERFERIAPILEDTLREYTELARSAREMMPEVRRTNDDLQTVIAKAGKLETEMTRAFDEALDAVRQYKRLGERVDVIVQTNRDEIDRIIRNVADMSQRIVALLNDENQRNFAAGIKNLQSMTKNLDELSTQLRTRTLPQLDGVLLNIQQFTKPLADRADHLVRNLDASLVGLARTAGAFGDAFAGQNGAFQRFLADPAIYNNLNDASLMVTRILPRVDRILKDFEVFADKIARHPETIGVGGAVRPSAGLKDPPGAPPYR